MPSEADRRKELRVELPVQVRFNLLEPGQEFIRSQWADLKGMEPVDLGLDLEGREALQRYLEKLDTKVNMILSLLADRVSRKDYRYQGRALDISESGLRIESPVLIAPDTLLEVGLSLPTLPYRTLDAAARVQWDEESHAGEEKSDEPGRVIGLKFIDILPQDQDEIVHWIFQKQREEIRRRRNELDLE